MSRVVVDTTGADAMNSRLIAAMSAGLDDAASVLNAEMTRKAQQGQNAGQRIASIEIGDGRFYQVRKRSIPGRPPGQRTGQLAELIGTERNGVLKRRVGSGASYARFVEFGFYTAPHTPRQKRFLAALASKMEKAGIPVDWKGGNPTYVKARPFIRPSLKGARRRMQDAFARRVAQELIRAE